MDLLQQYKDYIKKGNLFQPHDKLLLAVSGGVDSVVLCELCKQAGFDFAIAHCNFQLRGEESDGDEALVKEMGKKYKVLTWATKFETNEYASREKLSIQEAARELRYRWFQQLLKEHQYQYILTAHHADDNIETVVFNFFRGTGISGLTGISPKKQQVVRPLLFAWKKDLLAFAAQENLTYREDASNLKDDYSRNFIRNQLIPQAEKIFVQTRENLKNNIERWNEVELLYTQRVQQIKRKLLVVNGNEIHIPVLKLKQLDVRKTIVFEVLGAYGFSSHQAEEVLLLLESDSGKYVQSLTHRVIKNRNWLILAPNQTTAALTIAITDEEDKTKFQAGVLQFIKMPVAGTELSASPLTAMIDAGLVKFPLLLRKWKQGDYFYPLGMQKKKKLSRFFIDQKLSLPQKENTWVLEMDKKIIWVIGLRIDDRFKITAATKNILQVLFTKTGDGPAAK